MDEMQSCLDVLRDNDVDVDNAVDRLMGNDNLYLEFIKRLPEELHLATIREALAQQDGYALLVPQLLEQLQQEMQLGEVIFSQIGPTVGTHLGPGCVALFYLKPE